MIPICEDKISMMFVERKVFLIVDREKSFLDFFLTSYNTSWDSLLLRVAIFLASVE